MKNLKKIVFCFGCILMFSLTNVVFAVTGKVTGKTVRIRENADASSEIVTNAYRNDEVDIIEDSGDWYKVKYEGNVGYISKEYIQLVDGANVENREEVQKPSDNQNQEENLNSSEKTKIIKETKLKLLPNFSSRDLGIIQTETEVEVKKEFNNWIEITIGSNKGWILKNSVNGYEIFTSNKTENQNETIMQNPEPENKNEVEEPQEQNPQNLETSQEESFNQEQVTNENNENQENNSDSSYEKKSAYISVDTARVRQTAGGKIIGNVDIYDEVVILGEEGDWYKITCSKFETGYVSKELVTIGKVSSRSLTQPRSNGEEEGVEQIEEQPQSLPPYQEISSDGEANNKGQEIVDYAKTFLGARYISGGTSPNGFDCSGFTQYVYSHFGYSIERVCSGQANNGVEVSRDNLQLGDILVFLDNGNSSIGHVGIYIGDGNFVHAANPSRGVVIDNLNSSSYYNSRYVTTRRIIE